MKNMLANLAAGVWFFGVLIWFLFVLPIFIIMIPNYMGRTIKYGFATTVGNGITMVMVFGLLFGITMLVPAFRRCYKKLPWLYPYTVILTVDLIILSAAEEILNYGYKVQNDTRHVVFVSLMVVQIILCRLAMCIYMKKKNMKIARDEYGQ